MGRVIHFEILVDDPARAGAFTEGDTIGVPPQAPAGR